MGAMVTIWEGEGKVQSDDPKAALENAGHKQCGDVIGHTLVDGLDGVLEDKSGVEQGEGGGGGGDAHCRSCS